MLLELNSAEIALIIESLQDRKDYSERDEVRSLDAYIQEEENQWVAYPIHATFNAKQSAERYAAAASRVDGYDLDGDPY